MIYGVGKQNIYTVEQATKVGQVRHILAAKIGKILGLYKSVIMALMQGGYCENYKQNTITLFSAFEFDSLQRNVERSPCKTYSEWTVNFSNYILLEE